MLPNIIFFMPVYPWVAILYEGYFLILFHVFLLSA